MIKRRPLSNGDIRLGISKKDYANAMKRIIEITSTFFPKSKFGVAIVSQSCHGVKSQWEPIREAQEEIIETNHNVFRLSDSDAYYGSKYRYDKCHFNKIGAKALSNDYLKSIQQFSK